MDYFELACSITNNYAEKIRRENLMDQQNVIETAPTEAETSEAKIERLEREIDKLEKEGGRILHPITEEELSRQESLEREREEKRQKAEAADRRPQLKSGLRAPMDDKTESTAPANGTKLSDLADIYLSWRLEKENAEEQLKKANEMIRKTEQEIYEKMQTEEIEKFAHAGQLFFPRVESHPSVNKAREPEFYEWLREHNEDGIMKLTIHPQMLKSWYRQHEEFAEELASNDFLKVFEEIRISVRKAG